MRIWMLFVILMFSFKVMAIEDVTIKTFKEWKSEKVQSALQQVVEQKSKFSALQRQGTTSKDVLSRLSQAEFNLEIARDLTVSDYFDIYMKSQDNYEKSVTDLSARLSPNEVAEMLLHFNKANKAPASLDNHDLKIAEEPRSLN
jgi:hypothetical protein